jgi:hypothetical protein
MNYADQMSSITRGRGSRCFKSSTYRGELAYLGLIDHAFAQYDEHSGWA